MSATGIALSRRVEEAAINAWPAAQQMVYDGWLLRFSQGYTKRANSVNPLYNSAFDPEAKIAACEVLYTAQGLSPIFRITPFAAPPDLDARLVARGYQQIDRTLVQVCDLDTFDPPPDPPGGDLRAESLDGWLETFCRLKGASLAAHAPHRAILARILTPCRYGVLSVDGEIAACAVVVREAEVVGLFDLVVAPALRNRGYGTALTAWLLGWARDGGARTAYLQVVEANAAARRVYESKLGFRTQYTYWYRVPGA